MFSNRSEAGKLLADKLGHFRAGYGIVLAVPRGGVPVASEVAQELHLPMDIILTKKIRHPLYREYAIGAASLSDYFVEPHEEVTEDYIIEEITNIRARLSEMNRLFRAGRPPANITGKTIIVTDDGMATGNTILASINMLKKDKPGKIIIAAPVASESAVIKLSAAADEVITLITPHDFRGVGAFYQDFHQVSDEEVLFYLDKFRKVQSEG